MNLVVFKVGGSLLDLPLLPDLLRSVLNQRLGCDPLVVVGGAAIANVVREWDRIHHLGDESAHWLALKSLRVNEGLLAELVPLSRSVSTLAEFASAREGDLLPILCSEAFLRAEEKLPPPAAQLPHTWDVTSDSIAAGVAHRWRAGELILLKSTTLPAACTIHDAIQSGLVDRHFERASATLPQVSWANLRDHSPQIVRWL